MSASTPMYIPPAIWHRCARMASPLAIGRLGATCKAAAEGVRCADVWARFAAQPRSAKTLPARLAALEPWQQRELRVTTSLWDGAGAQWQRPSVCEVFRIYVETLELGAAGYVINLFVHLQTIRDICAQQALPKPNLKPVFLHALPLAIADARRTADRWREVGEKDWEEGALQRADEYEEMQKQLAGPSV